jgi:hypothetical protein
MQLNKKYIFQSPTNRPGKANINSTASKQMKTPKIAKIDIS